MLLSDTVGFISDLPVQVYCKTAGLNGLHLFPSDRRLSAGICYHYSSSLLSQLKFAVS